MKNKILSFSEFINESDTTGQTAQTAQPAQMAQPAQTAKHYYYAPGEERPRSSFVTSISIFPFTQAEGKGANPFYDILGRRQGRVAPNTVPNQDKIPEPKIPTSWFTVWAGSTSSDGKKTVAYHPTLGQISDPITYEILYSPGKDMSDEAVYQWLFDYSGRGAQTDPERVLVGTVERKNGVL